MRHTRIKAVMSLRGKASPLRERIPTVQLPIQGSILAAMLLAALAGAPSLESQEALPSNATTATIVEGIQRHDRMQSTMLQRYEGLRHYSVTYKGFAKTITASMDVEIEYDASSAKSFRIISQKGSNMLCEKVLKRALDSEREASLHKSATALNSNNYKFNFVGNDRLGERPAYVLSVEPISPSKFLYKGKIWVDAADYAVARLEVQPSKNPSFWISRTLIHHTNQLTNGFWLPEQDQSETKVRVGGTATMSIEYQSYRITSTPPYSTTSVEAAVR